MFLKRLFGTSNAGDCEEFVPLVENINNLELSLETLSSEELKSKTEEFKKRLNEGETFDGLLPEAFACVREASRRTLKQRHYDVQLLGGIILHKGNITEMKTGEGKTLVATLPAYLNALSGGGVHIVTVNDYLARRDAVWMGQIYNALGLTVGVLNNDGSYLYDPAHGVSKTSNSQSLLQQAHDGDQRRTIISKQNSSSKSKNQNTDPLDETRDMLGAFKVLHEFLKPCAKKEAYAADITYGTNNEFGFDYLRDNLAYSKNDLVGRGFHFAIVDEIDSILIDEARTPLIISAPAQESESLYYTFAKIATSLNAPADFTVDEKMRAISLTDSGITKAEKALGIPNIYTEKGIKYVHHLENSIRAKALFNKDKEYVVRDNHIVIVDEFTGRLQPGRRWSEGLHQAIEAKEGLTVERESRTVASITFQNYFRLYKKLSGMTGTALTSQEEFHTVYNLTVFPVPTNKAMRRMDHNDLIFQTEKGKFKALIEKVRELHARGQPVLIGTVSIEKNELLFNYLKKEGIPHQILNAKNHEGEGEIIAQAGRKGAVTVATNMAGRGVDIILGGNPHKEEERDGVLKLGGLFVIGTERHEARRIDNQLRGRSGRQGDPGETQFYVSLEDTLMRVFASDMIKKMMGRFGIPEDQPIENRLITKSLEGAQEKIEGFNFDARKHILEYDTVLNKQRQTVYALRRSIIEGELGAVKKFLNERSEGFPDLRKVINEKTTELGEEVFLIAAGRFVLQVIDMHWMEHLEAMDYLRSSVNLRAYGQRDPLVEYKKEGLRLFKEMNVSLDYHLKDILSTVRARGDIKSEKMQNLPRDLQTNVNAKDGQGPVSKNKIISKQKNKVGRNDLCPCGSGKKYKRCHGA